MKLVKTASGKQKIKMSKSEWESIGKTAGWIKKNAISEDDIREDVRFYDPRTSLGSHTGRLVTRKYHQTTLWMMLYDDGTIEELTNSDLERIELK